MQIVEGLRAKASWEVTNVKQATGVYRGAMALLDFQVLVNGNHQFKGTAFDNDVIFLKPYEGNQDAPVPITINPNEDHAVRRDLVQLGFKQFDTAST